ncbi:cytochrome c oxidase assembly protein subunit 15 [Amycolatopsis bartoniae]|uniref:COX15/CtaA family protein n=1 Tax=Amycolatopsis bartoniae TaxID=941986 RepID=UPI00119043CD|nr:COX15/CtaA family protein [Amycolatopsis bartoniae]MBB2939233.1 cytochrome c oxidase assembly protein subunit 15 [Amycolatopsis bartoniae]TVT09570.1 heme A synthase [Amycolatopsis bartoniae]
MVLNSLVARLPLPSPAARKAVGIAAIVAQAGIGVTGSVVRVTGSGLGCATWPQCQPGSMVPVAHDELHGIHQWIEFSNRLLTGVVILVAVLAVFTAWRVHLDTPRKRLLALAWTMPGGVVLQAVVGGMTVLAKLEWWTVAIHFLASTPLIWLATLLLHAFTEGDERPRWLVPPIARTFLVALVVLMWAILVAGTTVTGAGPHGGDTQTHRLDAPIETLARVHSGILVVYLVVLAVFGLTLLRTGASHRLWRRYGAVWLVAVAQGILGVVQYALGVPEALVSLHVLGSALVIVATGALWCGARDRGLPPVSGASAGRDAVTASGYPAVTP